METNEMIALIKESFEVWYNNHVHNDSKVSIAINYSDEQRLSIKAIHTITIEVRVLGIKNNLSYTNTLVKLQECYNHGITSEEGAKIGLIKKLLVELYSFKM